MDNILETIKKKTKKSTAKPDDLNISKQKKEETYSLKAFGKTCEPLADFNITKPYIGIEYEFQRKPMKNVKITSCTVSDMFPGNDKSTNQSSMGISVETITHLVPRRQEHIKEKKNENQVKEKLQNPAEKRRKKKNKDDDKKSQAVEQELQAPAPKQVKIHNENLDKVLLAIAKKCKKSKEKQTKIQNGELREESPCRLDPKINTNTKCKEVKIHKENVEKEKVTPAISQKPPKAKEKQTQKNKTKVQKGELREESPCRLDPIIDTNNKCKFELFLWEGNQRLVVLKENETLICYGYCSVKVVYGKLSILGSILDKRSKMVDIYSPRGSSLLALKNVTDEKESLRNLASLKEHDILKQTTINKKDVVFIVSSGTENNKIKFLKQYTSEQIFPKITNLNVPQVTFYTDGKFNSIAIHPEWGRIINMVDESSKMLIVGGGGVGKSTFVRFSINRLLSKFPKVRVIDLDPGQSEFTVPGCISVLEVSEPVFGPSYTHLTKVKRSILTNIDTGHAVNRYLNCIKTLMNSITDFEDMPTLINYMGFTQSIGINIACSAVTFVKPTHVVQIKSLDEKNNFGTKLKAKIIKDYCNMFVSDTSNSLKYTHIEMMSMNSQKKVGLSLKPRQIREMAVVAYFSQIMSDDVNHLSSHKIPMYKIDLSSIKLSNDKGQKISPAAINAQLVAMCSEMDSDGYFEVLGHGVVREIDDSENCLVLITPEPPQVLEKVFHLVRHSVSLPPSMYMDISDVTTSIPFVMTGELDNRLDQMVKRSYLPANKTSV
ncbi:polynucleotide 5'-hydroxyl-kinase NOL9 [Diabrotica undecimpunctata]|uniref:polynucleotide 5'-hydroxyl-kinase NOL9 n=1 Tax=Diabrotica undecimpunctata TaxID=50387 RepID=UPI003B63B0D0